MKIVYLTGSFKGGSDTTEDHIFYSLKKLGHDVKRLYDSEIHLAPKLEADLFLFHKGVDNMTKWLPQIPYKKVFWYFDKVWKNRVRWMKDIVPLVDKGFLTDGTWLKENPNPKLHILHQGIGDKDLRDGVKVDGYNAKICFTGNIYDERASWAGKLFDRYQYDFKIYGDVFNRDLFHLCASCPIFVAPPYPSDDDYWSSRIYLTLGSGGFLIHPKCAGLDEEYKDGEHYVTYGSTEELFERIDYFLEHPEEREKIRQAGMKKTRENFTYTHRVQKLLTML